MEEISGATIEDGILRYQVPISSWAQCVFVEEVLWVAEDQSFALTADGFYWFS